MAQQAAEIEVGGMKEQSVQSHVRKDFSFHIECRHLEHIFALGLKGRLKNGPNPTFAWRIVSLVYD